MSPEMLTALKATVAHFAAMSDEEFEKALVEHKNGDIYHFMMETGAAQMFIDEMKAKEPHDQPQG